MERNANTATRIDVEAGTRRCVQGRRRQEFGVVASGRARVERDGAVVAELGAGDHLGEFPLEQVFDARSRDWGWAAEATAVVESAIA
jgi:CRP-like cAMP-binding protein